MPDIIPTELSLARESQALTGEEKGILWNLRNKKLFVIIPTYLSLAFVIIEGWIYRYPGNYWEAVKELFRFRLYPTWFLLFIFIILTIYFTRYYLKSIHPIIKDLRACQKQVIFFTPDKYQTPYFAEFFLKTPFPNLPLIKIDKDLFDVIQPGSRACLNISVYARFVFSVEVNGIKEKFNYSVAFDDI